MSTFLRILASTTVLMMLAACEGPAGPAGTDGTNGIDGTNGVDGTNGTNGVDGVDGTNGVDGVDGVDGQNGLDAHWSATAQCTVCHDTGSLADITEMHPGLTDPLRDLTLTVTGIERVAGANTPTDDTLAVSFTVADAVTGAPITDLTMDPIRMMINQYEVAANAYDLNVWSMDYMYERGSTTDANLRLVQNAAGDYTYTFLELIEDAVTNDGADLSFTQQFAMRIRGYADYNSINAIYQTQGFPTAPGMATAVTAPVGNIVETSACESCHGPRIGNVGHGGGYNKVEYCRNCHTRDDATRVTNGADYMTMIHQIHKGYDHTQGGTAPGHDFSHVTYPQDLRNCNKCHQGVDGQNWNTMPTIEACGSCHVDVDFATGTNHTGGVQADNANCASCHSSSVVMTQHTTDVSTPLNPNVPVNAVNFEYVINSVTLSGDIPVVNFSILKDGTAITDLDTTYPPTGFTRGPNFKVAYALPQDGIDEPADWNNLGEYKSQPLSVGIGDLVGTSDFAKGTNAGEFVATLTAAPFPTGSTMRAVGMDGYFSQDVIGARHSTSVVMAVAGDAERRSIINYNGCLDCHEVLELHGGNRVLAADTPADSVAVCTMCHNPNLSSSGATFDIDNYTAGGNSNSDKAIALYGDDPLLWPEEPQNFKDLVHGIHGGEMRTDAFDHVRVRGGNAYAYDWSHVAFPNDPSRCTKCHVGDSYELGAIPATALMSTRVTDDGAINSTADADAARNTLPNMQDQVLDPKVAACRGCHAGEVLDAHMNANGGGIGLTREQHMP